MKKKMMFWFGVMTLICGLVIVGTNADVAAADKVIKWRFVVDWPATEFQMVEAVPRFAKWVEKASKGRLILSVYSGGQLVPPLESFDNLRRGTFEMLQSCGAYHGGKVPVGNPSFQLPMGPRGIKDYQKIFWDYGAMDLIVDAYRKLGVEFIAHTPWGGTNVISTKPLRTLEDFKGFKLRTVGPQAALWKEAGAATVYIPGSELYLALQTGVVDGYTWSNQSIEFMKMNEVTKYMICSHTPMGNGTGSHSGGVYVNAKAFKKLPADLQNILVRCAQQYARYSSMIFNDWDEWFMMQGGAKKLGMEVITLSKEDTNKLRQIAMEKIWPKLAKDEASKRYIEIVKQFLKDEGVI